MHSFTHSRRLHLSAAAAVIFVAAATCYAEPVTVRLESGRSFTAEPDAKTDARLLWLRFESDGLTILRPIEWAKIQEVRRGKTVLPLAEFRDTLVQRTKEAVRPRVANMPLPLNPQTSTAAGRGSLKTWRVPAAPAGTAENYPPVRSIDVSAYLSNWDSDVEADGILLNLGTYDATGATTPVAGVLEVELIGERFPPYTRGNAFPILGRWTQQVNLADYAGGGSLQFPLEFQALHPDYQLWIGRYALVHARLVVPGQGTFEASVDAVALRGFTPVRERVQQAFGTRFLPTEATGRGHRETAVFGP